MRAHLERAQSTVWLRRPGEIHNTKDGTCFVLDISSNSDDETNSTEDSDETNELPGMGSLS